MLARASEKGMGRLVRFGYMGSERDGRSRTRMERSRSCDVAVVVVRAWMGREVCIHGRVSPCWRGRQKRGWDCKLDWEIWGAKGTVAHGREWNGLARVDGRRWTARWVSEFMVKKGTVTVVSSSSGWTPRVVCDVWMCIDEEAWRRGDGVRTHDGLGLWWTVVFSGVV